ncbi:unnamed protein product [Sphagnum troendelagicum]|uniref:Uncharacterized protein n=1 Tax=Sphagnum troendelagicum TaxID=128251 RepID=A0ABP0TTJ8_9BRYO
MPEIGHSGETSQPAQEALRLGQDVRMSTMPEVGQSDVETSQPVRFYSFSRVHSSSFPRRMIKLQVVSGSTSEMRLDVMVTAGTKLQSVSEKKSVEVELFEASKDSEWIDAIEEKNCKLLLQTPFEFLWENARDGRLKNASRQDIWLFMEGPSDTAGDQWRQQRDLLAGRSGDDYVKSHVMCRMPVDSEDREMLSLREAISSIAIEGLRDGRE